MSSTDKGLLTPDNCAVIFIDHQTQMFSGVANIDRQDLLHNVSVLAKAAKIFGVPVILTAVESGAFSGNITPQLRDLLPEETPIERSSMNAWDDGAFVAAVPCQSRGRVRDGGVPDHRRWFRRMTKPLNHQQTSAYEH